MHATKRCSNSALVGNPASCSVRPIVVSSMNSASTIPGGSTIKRSTSVALRPCAWKTNASAHHRQDGDDQNVGEKVPGVARPRILSFNCFKHARNETARLCIHARPRCKNEDESTRGLREPGGMYRDSEESATMGRAVFSAGPNDFALKKTSFEEAPNFKSSDLKGGASNVPYLCEHAERSHY